jgi:(1->4)-alpha-D-glucan 1-alpha-D-glucosylmutase
MTFDRAVEFVPYLKALGISHLYASPIFTATRGSTHGYDVTDCNEIDPAIGGRAGFERLSAALKQADLGLILDIVPNHMAASTENAWWADVLKFGKESRYAKIFDIDWKERLTLPILGKTFDDTLRDGELELRQGDKDGSWSLAYFETLLPLAPGSVGTVQDPKDSVLIEKVHDLQHWRLTHWKDAAKHLSYRRFFEVTGLVGLRVEDAEVFGASHQLIFELVRLGHVHGLRLDHIDGLADPTGYLNGLRAAVGPDVFMVVEKILGPDESLPASWPVNGTTGYEFIAALSNLFINPDGANKLGTAYANLAEGDTDFSAGLRAAKLLMVNINFEGEVERLVRILKDARPELEEHDVGDAIRELLVAFPVYRTYASAGAMDAQDRAVLQTAVSRASQYLTDRHTLDAIALLLVDGSELEFRSRFQQLSGPIMAKAMEDTLFYRNNGLLAANEVGGEPDAEAGGVKRFHKLMSARRNLQPHGLSATSTHDTKRGEDARARLYALTECPEAWIESFRRWRELNRTRVMKLPDGVAPDGNVEWMLFQALAGIWPEGFDGEANDGLTERFVAYAEKAIREAKLFTNWNEPDLDYEEAVKAYAAWLTSSENELFRKDFENAVRPIMAAGYLNGLSQTLIKLTAPGIPDIYQGSEGLDFSLVDPDNRRCIDLQRLTPRLEKQHGPHQSSACLLKQQLIEIGLNFRRLQPSLFSEGEYLSLTIVGSRKEHVLAFGRTRGAAFMISVVPRMMLGHINEETLLATPEFWADTAIELPPTVRGNKRDLLTGRLFDPAAQLLLADVFNEYPMALIAREYQADDAVIRTRVPE